MTAPEIPELLARVPVGGTWWVPLTVREHRPPDESSRSGLALTGWHVEVSTPGEPHAVVALDEHDLAEALTDAQIHAMRDGFEPDSQLLAFVASLAAESCSRDRGGPGACIRNGYTADAPYLADRQCIPCQAWALLNAEACRG